jgi:hypothetical protein
MNRIVASSVAVALASLVLVTTASAINGRPDPVQTATRWAHFNRLLNPPAAAKTSETGTSAVPTVRGYRDFGLTNMQPAVVGAAVRLTSQAVGGSLVADTGVFPPRTGYRDFGLTSMQPAVVQAAPTAASEPLDEFGASGFDWADAGVGAAAMLGLVILAGLGAGLVLRGHHRPISNA